MSFSVLRYTAYTAGGYSLRTYHPGEPMHCLLDLLWLRCCHLPAAAGGNR